MKKISMILMAFALAITMSQCKKNEGQTTSNDEVVTITLDVKQNNGSKVVVNPNTGTVDFETGDKIYVGSGSKYVGFLTHNGTNFVGNITNPTENQPLQLYFLGNVTPQETLAAGTTEECSVVISDQTEHLPVISCAASNENYVSGVTAYSAHLLNKCALVKFNVTTSSNSPICITGMKNKVTVDFTQNTMIPSMDGDGVIKLPAGSGENVEKWAILLPQEALEEGEEGSAYSEDGNCLGIRPETPAIVDNGYLTDGINIALQSNSTPVVPEGAINGLFTINANGDQVYFSKGNLQYNKSTQEWSFMEHQYDMVETDLQNVGDDYSNQEVISLFGWGTSGYNHGAICYQPWNTSGSIGSDEYFAYGSKTYNLYDQTCQADWGYNPISNGGNVENMGWRTLKGGNGEWRYIFNIRNTTSGIRYAKGIVNGVNGVILLPDSWSVSIFALNNTNNSSASYTCNTITLEEWTNILEVNGAVFLPAAGARNGLSIHSVGAVGFYWSSSYANSSNACMVEFYHNENFSDIQTLATYGRRAGISVRLVKDYNP